MFLSFQNGETERGHETAGEQDRLGGSFNISTYHKFPLGMGSLKRTFELPARAAPEIVN